MQLGRYLHLGLADRLEVLHRVLHVAFGRSLDEEFVRHPADEATGKLVFDLDGEVRATAGRLEVILRSGFAPTRCRAGELEQSWCFDSTHLPAALQSPTAEL